MATHVPLLNPLSIAPALPQEDATGFYNIEKNLIQFYFELNFITEWLIHRCSLKFTEEEN